MTYWCRSCILEFDPLTVNCRRVEYKREKDEVCPRCGAKLQKFNLLLYDLINHV